MDHEDRDKNGDIIIRNLKQLNDGVVKEKDPDAELKLSSTTVYSTLVLLSQLAGVGRRGFRA